MAGVSKEQIAQARDVDLLSYMLLHEPDMLRPAGRERYHHAQHDSFVIKRDRWYWNSQGIKGKGALDYLMKVQRLDFVSAVEALTGQSEQLWVTKVPMPITPPKPFVLPEKAVVPDRVVRYLHGRGIPLLLIERCFRMGILYQSQKHGNCVFVGRDEEGQARFACLRGTTGHFKRDVAGSDKCYSFWLPAKLESSKRLAVFESPIDALSYAALQMREGFPWNGYRLSLGGTSEIALLSFLDRHPQINCVTLHLDNDRPGLMAAGRIKRILRDNPRYAHIKVSIHPPHRGKDYNADLQARCEEKQQNSQSPARCKQER